MLNRLNEIALQQYVFLDLSPGFPSIELLCETPQLSRIGNSNVFCRKKLGNLK